MQSPPSSAPRALGAAGRGAAHHELPSTSTPSPSAASVSSTRSSSSSSLPSRGGSIIARGDDFNAMGLRDELLRGIAAMGFEKPSTIQRQALPALLSGRTVVAQAPSGSGKSAAFSIPIAESIDLTKSAVQALILVHVSVLADAHARLLSKLMPAAGLRVHVSVGGDRSLQEEREALRRSGCPHAVVGTPGRVFDMIDMGALSMGHLKIVVLDEADAMMKTNELGKGLRAQVRAVLQASRLEPRGKAPGAAAAASPLQVCAFSATMTEAAAEDLSSLCVEFAGLSGPEDVLWILPEAAITPLGISHFHVDCGDDRRAGPAAYFATLIDILSKVGRAQGMIFCQTEETVKAVLECLKESGSRAVGFFGALKPRERNLALTQFAAGFAQFFVTTDGLARGLDVQSVAFVINYDFPLDRENYLHRVGRSGRFGRKGLGISFVHTRRLPDVKDIERAYGISIPHLDDSFAEHLATGSGGSAAALGSAADGDGGAAAAAAAAPRKAVAGAGSAPASEPCTPSDGGRSRADSRSSILSAASGGSGASGQTILLQASFALPDERPRVAPAAPLASNVGHHLAAKAEVAAASAVPAGAAAAKDTLGLRAVLLRGIQEHGVKLPTSTQTAIIGPLLSGSSILAQAPSGSGKTVAFVIPMLQLLDPSEPVCQGIVLCSSPALAEQTSAVLRSIARHMPNFRIYTCGGSGKPLAEEAENLSWLRPQIIVGTPSRLSSLFAAKAVSAGALRMLVIDEADMIVEAAFSSNLTKIVASLTRAPQICALSATLPAKARDALDEIVRAQSSGVPPLHIVVAADAARTTAAAAATRSASHYYAEVSADERLQVLSFLLPSEPAAAASAASSSSSISSSGLTSLVLCKSDALVVEAGKSLQEGGRAGVALLHGTLFADERDKVMAQWWSGACTCLVMTDAMARGLDLGKVDLVYNVDVPSTAEGYVHRAGRVRSTGRSIVVSLVEKEQMPFLDGIKSTYGIRFEELPDDEVARLVR